jgi:hypothetical protein
MILQETTNKIEQIGNVTEQATFKMKPSKKSFALLSGLYSDIFLAIVRELSCNCYDSHVMAGNADKPFAIHLPNALEPWITIQDFGTGIAHKDIYDIYTTYFESTKTNTNDQVGCMGLGSKTFMAYCDNAVVTSITEGVKRTYNVFFNEQGIPAIALLSQSPTTEGSGLSVQIPVKESDYEKFREATQKALRFFKVKPIITGGEVQWKDEKPMFSGKGWESYDKLETSFAIQGGVAYPIDTYKLKDEYYAMSRKGGLILYFNMGEINFTPSRESLMYDEHTLNSLNEKMKFVQKDFVSRVNDMIKNQPTILDALNCVHNLKNKFAYIQGMTISDKIVWQGQDITNPIEFISKVAMKGCVTYKKPSYYRRKINESVWPDLTATWVYDDLDKGAITRIKFWISNNEDKPITLFFTDAYNSLLESGFSKDNFVPVSSLPAPVKSKGNGSGTRTKKEKCKFNMYMMDNLDNKSWESVEFDSANEKEIYPKYYIVKPVDGWKFDLTIKGLSHTITSKHDLVRLLEFMGVDKREVMMISDRNLKYLPDDCQKLSDAVEDLTFKFDPDALETMGRYSSHIYTAIVNNPDYQNLSDRHPFKKFVKKVNAAIDSHKKFKSIKHWLDNSKQGKAYQVEGNDLLKEIVKKIGTYSWEMELTMKIIANLK